APQEAAPRRRAGSGLRDEPARDEPPPARSAADQPGGGGQPRRGRARARLPPPAGEVRRAAGMARGGGGVLDRAARLLQGARGTHAQGKARMKAEFARVTTTVEVDPKDAFEVFTEEIEAWWKPGPRWRPGRGTLRFDGGQGGRLVQVEGEEQTTIGRILVWEPGARLVFEWRGRGLWARGGGPVGGRLAGAA